MFAPHRFVTILSPLVIVGSASFVAGIAATYVFFTMQHQSRAEYVSVRTTDIVQSVQGTGALRPTEGVNLTFRRAGTLQRIAVSAGSRVSGKQLVATLSAGTLGVQLENAKGELARASAALEELRVGTSSAALVGARRALADQVALSYTVANAAVKEKAGQFIRPGSAPQLLFQTTNSSLEQSVLAERIEVDRVLAGWKITLQPPETATSSESLSAAATAAASHLSQVETFLNHTAALLAIAVPTDSTPASELEKYRAVISTARLSIANMLTELTASAATLSIAEVSSGPRAIETGQAALAAATAKVRALEAQLGETRLYAPVAGTISTVHVSTGDRIAADTAVVSLSSDAHAELVATFSPDEANKVHVGDAAEVQFEEYPGRVFAAQVVAVSPGGDGHKVTAQLIDAEPSLPFGLTGRIVVTTAQRLGALVVPASAIVVTEGQEFVLRASAGRDELVPVTVGVATDIGEVEIVAGLAAGDKVRSSVSVY